MCNGPQIIEEEALDHFEFFFLGYFAIKLNCSALTKLK